MLKQILFGVFLLGILSSAGCKKDSDVPDRYCVAGNEGNITVRLQPEHHGEPIPGLPNYVDSAFIKFNTDEYPGGLPSDYDLIVTGVAGSSEVVVPNLSCGSYFIFMTGFDVSIAERVKGGIPVYLEYDEPEKTLKIPVTED
jgi:hypothetical protein